MADVRLIDANALKATYENWLPQLDSPEDEGEKNGVITCIAELEDAPTVDAEPVRHGMWVHDINNLYGCSECLGRETMPPKRLKPYCPNCGAKMDGGEND